uniref:Uncharacterized protein n=1 Tax=Neogobius melanostomus TaxID=47308 RepID=A0A8C6UNZ5_9GOBI
MAEVDFKDFLTCAVCMDIFTDPVSLSCHHNFCSSCLQNYWDQNQTRNCPVCRRKSSKDHPGVNFAIKNLSISIRQKQDATVHQDPVCGEHPEVPPLFCKDETRAFCPVCEFSRHSQHTVVSGEEAERAIKEMLRSQLLSLTLQRQSYEELEKTYEHIQHYAEEQAQYCEHQVRVLFEWLQQFLREEENRALSRLREEQDRQAQSMETHSCPLESAPPCLRPKAGLLIDQAKVLGNLGFRVWRDMRSLVTYSPVLLDPNSAARWLRVSEDMSVVRRTDLQQQLPLNPERFTKYTMVLGSEGLGAGTHQWDVEVGDYPRWDIGVATESVDRSGELYATPKYGIWCLWHKDGKYTDGGNKLVHVRRSPERIRVQLDYDKGRLSFYDADHMTHLHTYKHMFTQKLYPYFEIGPAADAKTKEIRVCPTEGPPANMDVAVFILALLFF